MSSLAREMKANTSSSLSTVVPKSASTWTQSCWARNGGAEPGRPGKTKPRARYSSPDPPSEGARRQVAEAPPTGRPGRDRGTTCVPGRLQFDRGVQRVGVVRAPLGRVAVALEVEGGQAERAGGELLGHPDHRLVDAELVRRTRRPGRRPRSGSGRRTSAHSTMSWTPRVRKARSRRAIDLAYSCGVTGRKSSSRPRSRSWPGTAPRSAAAGPSDSSPPTATADARPSAVL